MACALLSVGVVIVVLFVLFKRQQRANPTSVSNQAATQSGLGTPPQVPTPAAGQAPPPAPEKPSSGQPANMPAAHPAAPPLQNTSPQQTNADASRFAVAKEVFLALSQGNLSAARSHFATSVSDGLSNDQLNASWAQIVTIVGAFHSLGPQTLKTVQGTPMYVTTGVFQNGNAELRIVFDSANSITGIWLVTVGNHPPAELEASAGTVADQLRKGDFQDVFNRFIPSVQAAAGNTNALSMGWQNVLAQKGQFSNVISAQKVPDFDVVNVICKFTNGDADVQVSFAPSMQLVGVYFLPAP